MYLDGKIALLMLTPVDYYIYLNSNKFRWFNFWNILNICILKTNTWKIWGHHASKFGIIYGNGGHIGFNYTHTSLKQNKWSHKYIVMYWRHNNLNYLNYKHKFIYFDQINWNFGHFDRDLISTAGRFSMVWHKIFHQLIIESS